MQVATQYALSKRGYYADFYTVPLATSIAVIWLYSLHQVAPGVFTSSILAGVLLWTFIEYAVHRWAFHGPFNREHAVHHVEPAEFIGFTSVSTAIIGAIIFWALTVTFGPVIGVGLLVGLVSGYLAYIAFHDRVHHANKIKPETLLAYLNRNHVLHHKRFRLNYGVTSPLWDMILGTYQANPAKPENEA